MKTIKISYMFTIWCQNVFITKITFKILKKCVPCFLEMLNNIIRMHYLTNTKKLYMDLHQCICVFLHWYRVNCVYEVIFFITISKLFKRSLMKIIPQNVGNWFKMERDWYILPPSHDSCIGRSGRERKKIWSCGWYY